MSSPIRDSMKPRSGKMRKDDDTVLDVAAILTKLDGVLDAVNGLKVEATLEVGDIEIGAVELKNATTDDRAEIADASAGNAPTTHVLKVQPVDEAGNVIEGGGGGGSAGGGNNTYSTEQNDFTATVTDATNDIVLNVDSIGGTALAANHFVNGLLKVTKAADGTVNTITLDVIDWTPATKTLDTSGCTGAFTFATGDVVSLVLTGGDKTVDKSTDAQRTSPIRGVEDQYTPESTVLTNIATNTTGYIYIETNGYRIPTIQCITSGTTPTDTLTLTLEATCQDDGTALSSCTFSDITEWMTDLITGVTSGASFVDVNCVLASTMPLAVRGLRLKYVTSNGGGADADLTVHVKKMF